MKNIGQRIKELRKKSDLTQERLADYLGVTDKAVSKWECGLTMPDLSLIVPLSRVLHVSADELLSGKPEEIDERRAEFDKHCDNWLENDQEENYQTALQATSEYPRDYKYLTWLAYAEMAVAYHSDYKEDPSREYSLEMLERAIEHNNIVIEECDDIRIREKAIWNAMICCKNMNRYEEALKYAEMFPDSEPITHHRAMEMCLQEPRLTWHRKKEVHRELRDLCMSLSRVYSFAEQKEPVALAALDTTEAVLKTVFPDGNYLGFHKDICCVYQTHAAFEAVEGNYDKAMEYLRIMIEHAKKIPYDKQSYTCGVLEDLTVDFSEDRQLLYIFAGIDDVNKPVLEQLRNRITTINIFAPLWNREDFKLLLE